MKTAMKKSLIWLALSLLMSIFWIVGLMIGNALFPSTLMESSGDANRSGDFFLLITSALNAFAVLYFIYNSRRYGWKLVGSIFLVLFGIQFFMSQIETVWFNDSLKMEPNLIMTIVVGGAIMAFLFAIAATMLTGRFSSSESTPYPLPKVNFMTLWKEILLLALILWPAVYFLAGYLIAWQFEAIRLYYSGSVVMESFFTMMKANFATGLYFFQIFRGFLWVLIAMIVISTSTGSWLHRGLILGLLLSFLGSSQLLLPNPIMPEMVRIGHLIETSTSSFIWGFILTWFLKKIIPVTQDVSQQNQISNLLDSQVTHKII